MWGGDVRAYKPGDADAGPHCWRGEHADSTGKLPPTVLLS